MKIFAAVVLSNELEFPLQTYGLVCFESHYVFSRYNQKISDSHCCFHVNQIKICFNKKRVVPSSCHKVQFFQFSLLYMSINEGGDANDLCWFMHVLLFFITKLLELVAPSTMQQYCLQQTSMYFCLVLVLVCELSCQLDII